jgi:hypothetical protein
LKLFLKEGNFVKEKYGIFYDFWKKTYKWNLENEIVIQHQNVQLAMVLW